MLIKGSKLRKETVLEIGKFSILWNCFERDWCENNCSPEKIKGVAETIPVSMETQASLAEILNRRRGWFGQLEMDYIRDSLHPGNARASTEENMQIMRHFLEQEGNDLIRGCLLVLYRIRNNLMHGLKLIEELDGQIELFQAANSVLESIGK